MNSLKGYCFVDYNSSSEILEKYKDIIQQNSIQSIDYLIDIDNKEVTNHDIFKINKDIDTTSLNICKKMNLNIPDKSTFIKIKCDYIDDSIVIQKIEIVLFNKQTNKFEVTTDENILKKLNKRFFSLIYENNSIVKKLLSVKSNVYEITFDICNQIESFETSTATINFADLHAEEKQISHYIDFPQQFIDNLHKDKNNKKNKFKKEIQKEIKDNDINILLNQTIKKAQDELLNIQNKYIEHELLINNINNKKKTFDKNCDNQTDKEGCLKTSLEKTNEEKKIIEIQNMDLNERKRVMTELQKNTMDTKMNIINDNVNINEMNSKSLNKTLPYWRYSSLFSNDDCIYIIF